MGIFSKIFAKDPTEVAREKLQELGKRFMNGLSNNNDLVEWDNNLSIIKSAVARFPEDKFINYFADGINDIFIKYLLKHYPTSDRLSIWFESNEDINTVRNGMYYEMLILTLGEALSVVHNWEFQRKEEYEQYISKINEYVNYKNNNKSAVSVTDKCAKLSEEELFMLIEEVKKSVPIYTDEQKCWHLRVDNLKTFKFC